MIVKWIPFIGKTIMRTLLNVIKILRFVYVPIVYYLVAMAIPVAIITLPAARFSRRATF